MGKKSKDREEVQKNNDLGKETGGKCKGHEGTVHWCHKVGLWSANGKLRVSSAISQLIRVMRED